MKDRKIYFAAAISAGRDDALTYSQIIEHLHPYGEVLTPQIGQLTMSRKGESLPASDVHKRDMAWVRSCDAVVAEISTPSLGVGYQLGKATEWGKPVLALYRVLPNRPLSKMIEGSTSIIWARYEITPEIPRILKRFFNALDSYSAQK